MVKVRTLNSLQYSLIVCVILRLVIPVCFAVDLTKTAKLLPPRTITLIDVDDYGQLKQQFDKTSMYGLYKDLLMAPFIEHVKSKWNESNFYFS